MQALGNFVIVEKIASGPVMMGGLEVSAPQDKETRYFKGSIVSIGIEGLGINPGDVVYYDRHTAHIIEENGLTYYIMNISDLAAKD